MTFSHIERDGFDWEWAASSGEGLSPCGACDTRVSADDRDGTDRAARIIERLDTLFEIGRDAGTNRPGLGEGEHRAHELVAGWMREAGLAVTVDGAGNLLGRAPGADPSAAEVWTGSHLDTPPDGGRFDGALGVVTALAAAAAIRASGGARRTIAVVAFRLEEGPRFGRGVFGSRALFGELEPDEADLVDPDGVTLGEAFAALGLGERLPWARCSSGHRRALWRRTSSRARRSPPAARRSVS